MRKRCISAKVLIHRKVTGPPREGRRRSEMSRYAVLIVGPLVIGILIATGILLINELRERRERARRALSEARRLDRAPSPSDVAARSARELKDDRIAS